jgi:hypothetical protein
MKNFGLKEGIFLTLGLAALAMPFWVFGGHDVLYVDKDGSGAETGSSNAPYHSIGEALKHARDGAEVRVKKGEYKESITIPDNVQVVGDNSDRDRVIINGNREDAAVVMKDDSSLSNITVKDARYGIRIEKNAKAHIFDVLVEESDRDGIHIDQSNKKDKKHRVFIDKVEVKKSGRSGIYSEERFVVIVNSNIHDNNRDGIDFQGDTKAWIENTRIERNDGSGLKIDLNGADIWTNKLSIRDNGREGVEVSARTNEVGNFGLKKATITGNKNFGVAKLRRGTAPAALLHQHVFIEASRVEGNGKGVVSGVISVR